jgi:hypothetical protein
MTAGTPPWLRSQLFQSSRECAGQVKQWPQGDQDDDSKSNQLGQILGLCAVGVAISDKTTDAYSRRCCAFHSITGKGQPFGRKRYHLKVTRLLPSFGKTRTDKSQIVSTKERRAKGEAVRARSSPQRVRPNGGRGAGSKSGKGEGRSALS